MKTVITTLILSLLTINLSTAQSREYYRDGNILKCNGTEYVVTKKHGIEIIEKENQDKDFSSRLKNGEPVEIKATTNVCKVENNEKVYPTVKHILSKYGFDIYDEDVPASNIGVDFLSKWLFANIHFDTDSKKIESIRFSFGGSSKTSTVPIEAFDEINKELRRILTCIPNEIGKQLVYCHVFYGFSLK